MSLRLRLALGLTMVIAAAFAVLGLVVVRSTRTDLVNGAERLLRQSLQNRVVAPPPPATRPPDGDPRGLVTAHLVALADGTILVAEPAGPPAEPTPLPAIGPEDIDRLRAGDAMTVDAVDGSLRYLVLGATKSTGELEIEAFPLDEIDGTVSTLGRVLISGGVVLLLLSVGALVLVVRQGLRPLEELVTTADAVAAGERTRRIPTDRGPTEVRHLSSALDRMVEELRASLSAQEASEAGLRRFISDASHELQTPITSVLGWTELQRKGALDADGERAAMARIEAESRRMKVLVDDLLLLARLDEQRPLERRVVDLAAVAHDAVTDAGAVDRERTIELDAPGPVTVVGDAQRLRQVLDNLLRNVRTHTPAGTRAVVTVARREDTAVITVADDGPGIEPDQQDRVFDRFWRRDGSRSRATGGSGLGLAIAAALVAAHGGSITAGSAPGGGAVFTISLPAAGDDA